MIYRFSRDLEANLRAHKFPVVVRYGPRRASHAVAGHSLAVRVDADDEGGDTVLPPAGSQRDSEHRHVRRVGFLIECSAQSTVSGAMINDHRALCDRLVDAVQSLAFIWCTQAKAGSPEFAESRYLRAEETGCGEVVSYVTYRMRVKFSRGVSLRDFDGASIERAILAEVSSGARVQKHDGTWETADSIGD